MLIILDHTLSENGYFIFYVAYLNAYIWNLILHHEVIPAIYGLVIVVRIKSTSNEHHPITLMLT